MCARAGRHACSRKEYKIGRGRRACTHRIQSMEAETTSQAVPCELQRPTPEEEARVACIGLLQSLPRALESCAANVSRIETYNHLAWVSPIPGRRVTDMLQCCSVTGHIMFPQGPQESLPVCLADVPQSTTELLQVMRCDPDEDPARRLQRLAACPELLRLESSLTVVSAVMNKVARSAQEALKVLHMARKYGPSLEEGTQKPKEAAQTPARKRSASHKRGAGGLGDARAAQAPAAPEHSKGRKRERKRADPAKLARVQEDGPDEEELALQIESNMDVCRDDAGEAIREQAAVLGGFNP